MFRTKVIFKSLIDLDYPKRSPSMIRLDSTILTHSSEVHVPGKVWLQGHIFQKNILIENEKVDPNIIYSYFSE